METTMSAIEMTGMVDEHQQLHLDSVLPIAGPKRVRVIVLYPAGDEAEAEERLQAVAQNPSFAFLHDAEEDIYSLTDGKPFHP